jgi:hypothetical protein
MSGLPGRPDLDQLRREARELLRAAVGGEPRAVGRLRAVSPRMTLPAAQLALAREYGFQSWTVLEAEVERRRSAAAPAGRRSFGGAAVLHTRAGVLLPEVLIAGAGHATLHGSLLRGSLSLSGAGVRRMGPSPGEVLARLVPGGNPVAARVRAGARATAVESVRALASSVTIVDDRGVRYALSERDASAEVGPLDMQVHLRVVPVPGPETGWAELLGQDGTAARLLPSPRTAARIGQLRPAQVTAARWTVVAGAALRTDGPQLHRDIGVALPVVDGVRIHLDSLVSLPGSWHLYLRLYRPARPPSRARGRAGRRNKGLIAVHAEDERGRRYLASYLRSPAVPAGEDPAPGRAMEREEVTVRFGPRLDPLAWTVRLRFQGAHQEIPVDLEIEPT